jgi:hypothetical protein
MGLAMLAAFAVWAYMQGKSMSWKIIFAVTIVLAVMTLWGIFAAPRSAHRLQLTPRLLFEGILFNLSVIALHKSGYNTLAIWFAVLAVISIVLSIVFKE